MVTAPAAEQRRLLDLQALDAKLKHLRSQSKELAADPEIKSAQEMLSAEEQDLVAARTAIEDIERELKRSDADVETVRSRIDRDQSRLDSGEGLSKDLLALQKELETLTKRRNELEEVELEIMERLENARAEEAKIVTRVESLREKLGAREDERDAKQADIDASARALSDQRQVLAGSFADDLLAVYEKTLAQRGIGAARLFHGRSEGSGMDLSPGDLAEINKAGENAIVFCPDSGVILIRSEEWNS